MERDQGSAEAEHHPHGRCPDDGYRVGDPAAPEPDLRLDRHQPLGPTPSRAQRDRSRATCSGSTARTGTRWACDAGLGTPTVTVPNTPDTNVYYTWGGPANHPLRTRTAPRPGSPSSQVTSSCGTGPRGRRASPRSRSSRPTRCPRPVLGLVINQFYQSPRPTRTADRPGHPSGIKPGDVFWFDGTKWAVLPTGGPGTTAQGPSGPSGPSIIPTDKVPVGSIENQLYRWTTNSLGAVIRAASWNHWTTEQGRPVLVGWQQLEDVRARWRWHHCRLRADAQPQHHPHQRQREPPCRHVGHHEPVLPVDRCALPSGPTPAFPNGLDPDAMFWWDGTKWNTPPKTPSTSSTQPVTYYIWSGPSQVLDNPDKTKPPVTVHDGDVYWWADGTWHTSKVPPVLPSGSTGGHKIPNTGDFVYYGPGGWDYGKPCSPGNDRVTRPPEFGSLPTTTLPGTQAAPTGTGYQWSGNSPATLGTWYPPAEGRLLLVGRHHVAHRSPLASGDPSVTTPPGAVRADQWSVAPC